MIRGGIACWVVERGGRIEVGRQEDSSKVLYVGAETALKVLEMILLRVYA